MVTATATDQLCKNFINGEWVESKSTKIFERRNPANSPLRRLGPAAAARTAGEPERRALFP